MRGAGLTSNNPVGAYKYCIWGEVDRGNGTAQTGASFSLKNSILLHDKYKPALHIYILQRIEMPPTPMSAAVMTVNTAAGTPILIPFGPSQSAGTVRAIDVGGIVTFVEARQAAAYAGIQVSNVCLHAGIQVRTTEYGSRPCPRIGHLLVLLDQLSIHACNFNHHLRNEGRIQRVYTLLAIADGNSGFVLAQAIVVLTTCLEVVRSAEGDHNMYLPGSLKMREHTPPHTGPIEASKLPSFSLSVSQLTSVFSCPAGMSTIWMAEIFPSPPPILTLRPSPVPIHKFSPPFPKGSLQPCPAKNAKITRKKKSCMSPGKLTRKGLK